MLKSIFGLVIVLGLTTANAAQKEIQITQSMTGTGAIINMNDDGNDSTTSYGFQGEVYFGMSDVLQVGGILGYSDSGVDGEDSAMNVGVAVRYNLAPELKEAMFVGGGLVYAKQGDANSMNLAVQAGKRIALSDSLTWTPNVTFTIPVSGEDAAGNDVEGWNLAINLISFSGFMD